MAAPDSWEAYLLPGERLLWEGAPEPGFRLRGREMLQILLGLPFFVIGVVLLVISPAVFKPSAEIIGIAIFVIGFGGFGGYLVLEPIFKAYNLSRHVRYALCNRAAFIVRHWPIQRIEVYPILPSTATELKRGDRVDTVWFHLRWVDNSDGGVTEERIGFQHIKTGAVVLRLIRDIQTGKQN